MFDKDKLYKIELSRRIYDSDKGGVFEFTYSEICVNFEQYMSIGTKIFYLKGGTKHNFSLNKSELDYLYTYNLRSKEPLNFVFSKNIEIIKKTQRSDLFLLTNLKNCEFVYLLPRLDDKNKFYFDLVLGVTSNFDINQFYSWVLKSINIVNVTEINNFNLDYNYVKNIFDFEKCKFRDNGNCKEEYYFLEFFINNKTRIKNWNDANVEKIVKRWNYKFDFKKITNHCYWYNDKIVQSADSIFFIDYKWDTSFVIKKDENGELIATKDYMFVGGLLDTFEYNYDTINFNSFILNKNL